ncbi:MAG: ribonuclease P protein component [Frankiaceae bacterium]
MLPSSFRMRSRADFSAVARTGKRAARGSLIVSVAIDPDPSQCPRVGVIVGRRVGGAVTRNRVRRQLRHLLVERVSGFPSGALVVVRARPPIADQGRGTIVAALDRALAGVELGPQRVGGGAPQ